MKTKSYDLVIFDCDGVLVNTEPLANSVFVQILAEHGHTVNATEYLHIMAGETIINRMRMAEQKLSWSAPANFMDVFDEHMTALTQREVQPIAGIHALLESLTVPACVASNGSRPEIILRLKLSGLTHFFNDKIFSGLEVPHPKPAPDVFLEAARAFNVHPSRSIVVEDSVPGATAAVRAGMRVYGHAAFTPAESLKAAGAIPFADMSALQNILAEI